MDNEHLRLLRIGYLIAGGTTLFATIIGLFYMGIGIFFASMLGTLDTTGEPNEFMSVVFIGIGAAIVLVLGALGALQLLTARYLRERRNHTLCQVAAALTCLSMPWGTAVGVATFMVLGRPSVRQQFGLLPPPPPNMVPPAPPQAPQL
jgi:hypothetical protein